jgi:hypothetical protein
MTISLYDATVRSFIQTVGAVSAFLDKGLAHFQSTAQNADDILENRLHHDMLPLRFQLVSVAHHSARSIEGAKAGEVHPPGGVGDLGYAAMQAHVAEALTARKAFTPDEVNALQGKDVVFKLGERGLPFVAENFLLTFSLPNLHFHATTAYDILRQAGVPLGKRDYMGAMQMKR